MPHKARLGWQSSKIKSTACFPDYYTDAIDGAEDDKIERTFAAYENAASPVFAQIAQDNPISDKEMKTIIDYVIVQIARTPTFFEYSNQIDEIYFPQSLDDAVRKLERNNNRQSKADSTVSRVDGNQYYPLILETNTSNRTLTATSCTGRHAFLSAALMFKEGYIANILKSSYWRIIYSEESLFTSDNPVVFLRYDQASNAWRTGLQAKASNDLKCVYMPLTPHHLLITCLSTLHQDLDALTMNSKLCDFIQRGSVNNAWRYIYSNHPDSRVSEWRPQHIDRELYQALEEERSTWHESNLELEREFFPRIRVRT